MTARIVKLFKVKLGLCDGSNPEARERSNPEARERFNPEPGGCSNRKARGGSNRKVRGGSNREARGRSNREARRGKNRAIGRLESWVSWQLKILMESNPDFTTARIVKLVMSKKDFGDGSNPVARKVKKGLQQRLES